MSDVHDTMSTPASQSSSAASASASAATAQPQHSLATLTQFATTHKLPMPLVLLQAAKLAIEEDRAIMLDYYHDSLNGKIFIGEDAETKEKVLLKSKEEFTSLIGRIAKVGDDCIVMTENSLYVVSSKIQKRRINLASLQQEAYSE